MRTLHRFPAMQRPGVVMLLIVFSCLPLSPAAGWSFHTHRKICSDALNRLPPTLFSRFSPHKDRMLQGATDPDTVIKDFTSHVYHPGGLTQDAESRVKGLWNDLIARLREGRDEEAAYTMGLLSHYIADFNQPLHTAGAAEDAYESEYHSAFEKEVQGQLSRIPIGEIRPDPVTDPVARLAPIARAAHAHYAAIGTAYRRGNRFFDVRPIVERQLTAAVQQTIDYWLGALQAAGQITAPLISQTAAAGPASGAPFAPPVQTQDILPTRAGPPATAATAATTSTAARDRPAGPTLAIDLNTATLDQLKDLPGIGEKRARAILEHRPFKSIYDLAKIERHGRKLFDVKLIERISDRIRVSP
ncbi:MAG: hypothetical protein OZSIB_3592 [Candidatus Ozemobacter sibiricus]|uniref:Helix-hairpin-helix DNA-binding motif class 1 domain-containing protein n=1 Tax=Candidatus Ozemobacter sibiricus TaxID=2268124 RepID=A0A367ZPN2_9BACT|nr:MAG: hypothetical protein OZSIB_3592 [Candidatus Ozemobacter sibiricus]